MGTLKKIMTVEYLKKHTEHEINIIKTFSLAKQLFTSIHFRTICPDTSLLPEYRINKLWHNRTVFYKNEVALSAKFTYALSANKNY